MTQVQLQAEVREEIGKEATRKLRGTGMVPAICYGAKKDSLNLQIENRQLQKLLSSEAANQLINLEIKGAKKAKNRAVLIKEVQRDNLRNRILHIDFHEVDLNEEITTTVPIIFVGEEKRDNDGGIVEHVLRELEIACLPTHIPEHVVVDVSKLSIGHGIHAGDLSAGEGVKILTPRDEMVVTVVTTRATEAETVAAPAAEAEPALVGDKDKEKAAEKAE